jgi:galactokinase
MDDDWTRGLAAAGLSPGQVAVKREMLGRARRALEDVELPPGTEVRAFFVPGRVEVLGKHTDYAGGRSLLCTVERGFAVVAAARHDRVIRVIDTGKALAVEFALDPDLVPEAGRWSNYPMTVARRLARNFPAAARGGDMAFVSDLPPDAGMSSSSALMIAIFLALAELNALERSFAYRREIRSAEDLAGYLGTVENGETFGSLAGDRGVGTFGGSEDHTAILCCQPGALSQYSFCPVRHERTVPLPARYVFVVATSGVLAQKTGDASSATTARLWPRGRSWNRGGPRPDAQTPRWRRRLHMPRTPWIGSGGCCPTHRNPRSRARCCSIACSSSSTRARRSSLRSAMRSPAAMSRRLAPWLTDRSGRRRSCLATRYRKRLPSLEGRGASAPWRRRRLARVLAEACGRWWTERRLETSSRAGPSSTGGSSPTRPRGRSRS